MLPNYQRPLQGRGEYTDIPPPLRYLSPELVVSLTSGHLHTMSYHQIHSDRSLPHYE